MGEFRNLKVWKIAKELAIETYKVTNKSPINKDYKLRDQMRAAAISIVSNIAEGDELQSNKQSVHFFYIAKGSCAELITQMIIASEIYPDIEKPLIDMISQYETLSLMLYKLILARKKHKF